MLHCVGTERWGAEQGYTKWPGEVRVLHFQINTDFSILAILIHAITWIT